MQQPEKNYGSASTPTLPQVNVAVFHIARCGSTVLGEMLSQHTKIHWAGESFHTNHERPPYVPSEHFVESTIEQGQALCTRPFYLFATKFLPTQHLRQRQIGMDLEAYISLLRSLGFSKMLVLHRRNYLRRQISAKVGNSTQVWHMQHENTNAHRVKLDVNDMGIWEHNAPIVDLFNWIDEHYQRLLALLTDDDLLYLSYEDDILQDPMIAYKKVCTFLEIEPESPQITLQRTNPFRYEEMLENFNEVQAALQTSPHAWMLAD